MMHRDIDSNHCVDNRKGKHVSQGNMKILGFEFVMLTFTLSSCRTLLAPFYMVGFSSNAFKGYSF